MSDIDPKKYATARDTAQRLRKQLETMSSAAELARVHRELEQAKRDYMRVSSFAGDLTQEIETLRWWVAGVSCIAGAALGILFGVMYVG